jgi:hypothetical protein
MNSISSNSVGSYHFYFLLSEIKLEAKASLETLDLRCVNVTGFDFSGFTGNILGRYWF